MVCIVGMGVFSRPKTDLRRYLEMERVKKVGLETTAGSGAAVVLAA
jgi:hypothetical protein